MNRLIVYSLVSLCVCWRIGKAQEMVVPFEPTFLTVLKDGKLPKYTKPSFGQWDIESGALVGREVEGENHFPSLRIVAEVAPISVLAFQFRFGDKMESSFAILGKPKRQIGITPDGVWIRIGSQDGKPARICGFERVDLNPSDWHSVRLEIQGEKFLLTVNESDRIHGADPGFGFDKGNFAIATRGEGGAFKAIRVWRGKPALNWKDDTPLCRELNLKEFSFLRADKNGDGQLTAVEFREAYQNRRSEEQLKTAFAKLDKNRDEMVSRREF